MKQILSILFLALLTLSSCKKDDVNVDVDDNEEETNYEINENGIYQDFLTPNYYDTNQTYLRNEVNQFIHFARLEAYQNPFQNASGDITPYAINREFGDGIGFCGTSQHHPAIDIHPTDPAEVSIYAMHDGIVSTYRDSPNYRHYLTITKDITDSENNPIGKLVTLYAHIDLDLDESESLYLNGLSINKGDLISENLYAGTMGGPHLHFEIRFYRNSELGNEDFYNWQSIEDYTLQSAGFWSYGYWNPDLGYGFGNPLNFGIE
ncbi:MAG: murein DD-endopeptidase MepM/ murein hydrolase activator NlpD [Crocinitomix sp.]|jgi:murein DD-endopeptidase MepM/ murein hydrolase activator NlpD